MNVCPEDRLTSEYLEGKFAKQYPKYFRSPTCRPPMPPGTLRIHRAIRWLKRAEKESDDPDAAFIFYWIAFNAMYAEYLPTARAQWESESFRAFFEKITRVDERNTIRDRVFDNLKDTILSLTGNPYVFRPYWNHYHKVEDSGGSHYGYWVDALEESKKSVKLRLAVGHTADVLETLFDRLYVLRNQLIHGGATWNSSVNRQQVEDGAMVMSFLVPAVIDLLIDNPGKFNGPAHYPPP